MHQPTHEQSEVMEFTKRSQNFERIVRHPVLTGSNRAQQLLYMSYADVHRLYTAMISVRSFVHQRVWDILPHFIVYMNQHENVDVRNVYASLENDRVKLVNRFIAKRPLVFYTGTDNYLLRNGQQGAGWLVGERNAPYGTPSVEEYMTYEELKMSALVSLSSYTYFINDGGRHNRGQQGQRGTFEEWGVIIGTVGARFEIPGRMEYEECIITPQHNTEANGYGKHADPGSRKTQWRRMWANLYALPYFPTWDEAVEEMQSKTSNRYFEINDAKIFDRVAYSRRMQLQAEKLLVEANQRGEEQGKKVYLHVVGLGLGVWQATERQHDLFGAAWMSALRSLPTLEFVADVDFSWIDGIYRTVKAGPIGDGQNAHIQLHTSRRNPHAKFAPADADKLLVEVFAWDGNSFPGNEYWLGQLTASGDPAAACASLIGELHNPEINTYIKDSVYVAKKNGSIERMMHEGIRTPNITQEQSRTAQEEVPPQPGQPSEEQRQQQQTEQPPQQHPPVPSRFSRQYQQVQSSEDQGAELERCRHEIRVLQAELSAKRKREEELSAFTALFMRKFDGRANQNRNIGA